MGLDVRESPDSWVGCGKEAWLQEQFMMYLKLRRESPDVIDKTTDMKHSTKKKVRGTPRDRSETSLATLEHWLYAVIYQTDRVHVSIA
ncbi:hypothetical protein TNCV_374561 [Trichonephila clavipes]|nr:hypothetical protein TNCV_374561 [Trichonephila clavipes]